MIYSLPPPLPKSLPRDEDEQSKSIPHSLTPTLPVLSRHFPCLCSLGKQANKHAIKRQKITIAENHGVSHMLLNRLLQ